MADATQSPGRGPAPQQFGKYWLDTELAEGGMSRVLLARLRGPGGFEKKLVVKQILPKLAQDPGFIELFVREANTLVQMSHPNIVPVYELGVVEGVYFLAMELVEGATVAELLRAGPLEEALCAHIGAQICEALHYAHARFGLVHRDVTPRNIIVDAGGHVRLLDFGIAAPLAHTGQGELFGSPGYMSPEQKRGAALGPESDLFSLGTVLYEALTGRRAFPRSQSSPDDAPERLSAADGVRPELAELVTSMLALDPQLRPKSAGEAGARFRTWLARAHPEGVAAALGRRAEQARERPEPVSDRPPAMPPTEPSATPRLTRSIATRPELAQLLADGTEPLARAPRRTRNTRRLRWALAPALALIAGVLLLVERTPGSGRVVAAKQRTSPRPAAPQPLPGPAKPAPTEAAPEQPPADPAGASGAPAANDALAATRPRLSINALPWADVRLDGRALGQTPKRALALSPGAHVLQLECPPLGRKARVALKLAQGEQKQVIVDMNASPPRVSVK